MHFTRKKVYKARTPEETIHMIQGILHDAGIFICENNTYHKDSDTNACSVRFGDNVFYGTRFSTNGKGMNARYALASAYGEMMERLQTAAFLRLDRIHLAKEKKVSFFYAPDEKRIKVGDLCPEAVESMKLLLKMSDEEYHELLSPYYNKEVTCVTFTDAFTDKAYLLPIDFYSLLFTSNGLCAGNTKEEALSQGLSEIFERGALCEIYGENPDLNKISPEAFTGTEILEKLNNLKSQGLDYTIIDASMGKDYPVIGLILMRDGKIMFNLGADPNPVVALERCLTEQFQFVAGDVYNVRMSGQSIGKWSDWKLDIQKSWYHGHFSRQKVAGFGDKPDNLFDVPDKYSEHYTYNDSETGDYEYLLNLIKKLGFHMYIRDCSYLGFPAYHIVVPELSLGEFYLDRYKKPIQNFLEDKISFKINTDTHNALIPIIKYMEEKQKDYYKSIGFI